jgi:hypothetical protein
MGMKSMPPISSAEPKVKRVYTGLEVDADGAEGETDQRRDRRRSASAAEHDDERQQPHHGEEEELGRTEAARHLREQRREQRDQDDADRAADEGRDRLHDERRPGAALLASG